MTVLEKNTLKFNNYLQRKKTKNLTFLFSAFQGLMIVLIVSSSSLAGQEGYVIYLKNGKTLTGYNLFKSKTNPRILVAKKGKQRIEIPLSSIREYEEIKGDETYGIKKTSHNNSKSNIRSMCNDYYENCLLNTSGLDSNDLKAICRTVSSTCKKCVADRGMSMSEFRNISSSMISAKKRYNTCMPSTSDRATHQSSLKTGYDGEYDSYKARQKANYNKRKKCSEDYNKKMSRLKLCRQ